MTPRSKLAILPLLLVCALHAQEATTPPIGIGARLAEVRRLFETLKWPTAHDIAWNYDTALKMQLESNAADDALAMLPAATQAPADVEADIRIHTLMAAAGVTVGDNDMYQLHSEVAYRRCRDTYGYDQGGCQDFVSKTIENYQVHPGLALQPFFGAAENLRTIYTKISGDIESLRNASVPVTVTFDRSTNLVPLDQFVFKALPEAGHRGASEEAEQFADSLDRRLQEPIVKNWFLSYYLPEAERNKVNLDPADFFAASSANKGKAQWIGSVKDQFSQRNPVVMDLRIPEGEYYVYRRGAALPERPQANLIIRHEGGQSAGAVTVRMAESGTAVEVTGLGAPAPAAPPASAPAAPAKPEKKTPNSGFHPEFSVLDFRLGVNKLTFKPEGTVAGRMFQRLGGHVLLQAQGSFDFHTDQDWRGLDRNPPAPPWPPFVPREQRGLTYYNSRELQIDAGPVLRVKNFQFAAMHSARYIGRGDFDQGGWIGQWFFNAGYIFKLGQAGVFATRASLDEPVVGSIQYSPVYFEETYLKVVNQYGGTFQLSLPKVPGYLEGAVAYANLGPAKAAPGGSLRYALPVRALGDMLALTVEAGYNEGFILTGQNTLRLAVGLRLGRVRPSSYLKGPGPAPVVVPTVRYQTLTRLVRRGNTKPIAVAGPNQLDVDTTKGDVFLSGVGSYDPDGDPISFTWSQQSGPKAQLLPNPNVINPHFTAQAGSQYVFVLVVTDSYGLQSDPATVTITTAGLAATITSFTATPASIAPGQSATLAWTTQNAASATLGAAGGAASPVAINGNAVVSPTVTTTYILTATTSVGQVTASVTVQVGQSGSAPTITQFTAAPATISAGQTSTLTWKTQNAASATLATVGGGAGAAVAVNGSIAVSPAATTTYILTATSPSGTVTSSVTVQVGQSASTPTITQFTATPASIAPGQPAVLSWATQNATSATLGPAGGAGSPVSPNGSITVSPAVTTTYVLTAISSTGQVNASVTVQVTAPTAPTISQFTAAPATIPLGQSAILSWSTQNATSATLSAVGGATSSVSPNGSATVTPAVTTTYVLTAIGSSGQTNATLTVQVTPMALPVITQFTGSPTTIIRTTSATLSWTTQNATDVSLGTVGSGATSASVAPNGSVVVTPNIATTYILTATNSSGQVTATVTIQVLPNYPF